MERTCVPIPSRYTNAIMHLEIYAPDNKNNLKILPQLSVFAFLYYRRYSIINISKDMREAVKCQIHTVHYV